MVTFTTIARGTALVSILLLKLSDAAPAKDTTTYAPHLAGTNDADIALPPFIADRIRPASNPSFDANLNVTKREAENINGLTMEVPKNAPKIDVVASSTVTTATTDQISTFKLYAGIASTPYCRSVVPLGAWLCKNCLINVPDGKLISTFDSIVYDSTGFVLRSDAQKTIHLVFRGTSSIRSTITDMIVTQMIYPPVIGALVHTGFYASFLAVRSDYFSDVQKQLTAYPNYKVVVSGHSLGGAHALLAALDLYQRDSRLTPSNLSIYTVGAPRVGNRGFANYVDSTGITFVRSVNDRDIVPHVPSELVNYRHAGTEAWIRSSSKVYLCASEAKECSNSIEPFTSFTDHLSYYGFTEGLCV